MESLFGKIGWVILASAWWIIRRPFERKAQRARIARDEMNGVERARLAVSLTGLGVIPFLHVAFGFPRFADYTPQPFLVLLGWLVMGAALVMFYLTHKALGRNWSVSLQLKDDHRLVTEGIYAHIRHPMYTAFWLWAVAQALLLPNWVAGFSGVVGFGALYLLRVGPEEQLMIDQFGDEYRDYMKRTGRLLPRLTGR
jgi:protein-S-isoprenylcysteine O-methyltransferase Ste14